LSWPLAFQKASIRRMAVIAVCLLVIANSSRVLLAGCGASIRAMEYSTFTRLDPIALGILIALFGDKLPRFSRWERVMLFLCGSVMWVLTSAFCLPDRPDIASPWRLTVGLPLTALGSVAILLSVANSQHPFLRQKPLVYLGKISYGLYVLHLFALSGAARLIPAQSARLTLLLQSGVGLLLTVLLASVSYRWLERPFLRLKERFSYVESRPV